MKREWIPVTEDLPRKGQVCAVECESKSLGVDDLLDFGWMTAAGFALAYSPDNGVEDAIVKKWYPIPE